MTLKSWLKLKLPLFYCTVAIASGWGSAIAQTPPEPHSSTPLLAQEAETPPDFSLTPRVGGQFTTGPEAGYNSSYGSIYGWIPFAQTPGSSLAFAEGRFNIATVGGRLGGNLLLGYRNYIEASDLVWGAYLGYDIRSDNSKTYHQLSTGADFQTGIWETRINGYFPIANTTNTIANNNTILSSTATNPQFVGNFLQFTQTNTVRRESIVDSALTGFDLETGAKLYSWEGGDLRGYLGTYLYGGENVSTFVGLRSRLVARPTPNTNIGLTLQTDGEFGTNLILSFGASFGGSRSNQTENTVVKRLGEGVQRQSQIALARNSSSSTTTTTTTTNATNPATGQPWFFRHVTSTGGNGNGTFESPYNTITEALNGIASDGNQIVYVQGSGTFAGNLTIPSNVQLLSTGPTQQISTTTGNLTLPLSGSGNIPTINGTVALNSGSLIDGFNLSRTLSIDSLNGTATARNLTITTSNESGISCSNITGTATLNLTSVNVNTTNSNGINCTNVSGSLTLSNGTVTTSGNQAALSLQNSTGSTTFSGMTVTANNGGLLQGNTINNLSITNSTLVSNNAPGNGIDLENVTGTATISGNTGSRISGATTEGVALRNSTGTINLSGFTIANSGQNAVRATSVTGTLNVSNNTISNSAARAFYLVNTAGNLNLTLANNQISDSVADGIRIDLSNTANMTATVSGNTIDRTTSAAGDAIDFEAIGNSVLNLEIRNNTISNSGNSGIELEVQNAGILNSRVINNTISNSGGDGILFLHNSSQNLTMTVSANTITNSGIAANGITKTPGPPPINVGNGGFGIGVLTLANGNLQLDASLNRITDSQDAKIGIAANPNFTPFGGMSFPGSSRIDANFQFNTLAGTGAGATTIAPLNAGSLGALVDNNGTICTKLQFNTANDVNGAGYLFARFAATATFIQDTGINTGTVQGFALGVPSTPPNPIAFPSGTCNLP
ncbi:MAG: right-handed parallel beta-helix repeat-containing protein [Jaaginema sp. PMC 1079.18]|nr:right-handed parallel beta-helix repeat-containing protein [Jaaginema sp. PMC 1080.18]MEC4851337.1 right-handed parallel beta-helix repeat-containing protein [Jaaginema sp. PMC 1079.18]MEC4865227.1 right-handed parallel beta-helix repeat-containing protein [Jaaginema sp. PMC 1078.18]